MPAKEDTPLSLQYRDLDTRGRQCLPWTPYYLCSIGSQTLEGGSVGQGHPIILQYRVTDTRGRHRPHDTPRPLRMEETLKADETRTILYNICSTLLHSLRNDLPREMFSGSSGLLLSAVLGWKRSVPFYANVNSFFFFFFNHLSET